MLIKLNREEFRKQALTSLNGLGRLFLLQLFSLGTAQVAAFVLGLLSFQPTLEAKRLLYGELACIVITTVKQVVNIKRFKFKVGWKCRPEVHQQLQQRILQDGALQKLDQVNVLLEFFLRVTLE